MHGHVHEESFTLMKSYENNEIHSISYDNPSLTTYYYLNPSFRVYEMDAETLEIIDYLQYRLNLTKSNIEGNAFWYKSYRFTEFFNVKDMSIKSHETIVQKIMVFSIRNDKNSQIMMNGEKC